MVPKHKTSISREQLLRLQLHFTVLRRPSLYITAEVLFREHDGTPSSDPNMKCKSSRRQPARMDELQSY